MIGMCLVNLLKNTFNYFLVFSICNDLFFSRSLSNESKYSIDENFN